MSLETVHDYPATAEFHCRCDYWQSQWEESFLTVRNLILEEKNPFSPLQRRLQNPPAKSKFLAVAVLITL
jgi:hypothetical protein